MKDFKENLEKCQSYIRALEEERRKIEVFQRELPLCLELVTQAIDACKQQLSGASNEIARECLNNGQNNNNNNSECTSDNGPIFEEFIPLKRSHCSDDDDDEHHHDFHKDEMSDDHINHLDDHDHDVVDKSEEKSDWLRSVQLWNQTPDPPTTHQEQQPKRVPVVEVTNSSHQKIEKQEKIKASCTVEKKTISDPTNSACTNAKAVAVGRPAGSSSAGGGSNKKEEKGGQRKTRRCWSPELHERFLHALQQLGGSNAATPKQIRELMKVDGLTNDEVKSHLQKYRLHTRRPTSTTSNNNSNNQQSHQFVVVGGIWMPPSKYNSMAPIATNSRETSPISTPNNIYAPIATMAPSPNSQRTQHKQASQSHEERGSHSHGGLHSNSTSTSSSTHTTTAS